MWLYRLRAQIYLKNLCFTLVSEEKQETSARYEVFSKIILTKNWDIVLKRKFRSEDVDYDKNIICCGSPPGVNFIINILRLTFFVNKCFAQFFLVQEGATYGPRATSGPRRLHFMLSKSLFGINLARVTQIKAECGPQTKIVAHPCSIYSLAM